MSGRPPVVLRPQPSDLPAMDSYARLIRRNWNHGQDLIIIEHDIIPHGGVFSGFAGCQEGWCVYPYALTTRYAGYLGCVRFQAGFMRAHPEAAYDASLIRWESWQPGDWRSYADCLWRVLQVEHARPHVHIPPVGHTNPKQQIRAEEARGWCKWPVDMDTP